jgi:hypothetical protein
MEEVHTSSSHKHENEEEKPLCISRMIELGMLEALCTGLDR